MQDRQISLNRNFGPTYTARLGFFLDSSFKTHPCSASLAIHIAGAWQLPYPVARQILVFRITSTLLLAASLIFASLSSGQTSDGRPSANQFVRQIIDNELQAENNDHSHWMLRLETRKSGKTEVREVVETKDGDLDWLISVNGKPLPQDQRRERERGLQRLISNPAELKRSQREKDEDQGRSQRLLKLLPDALVFEYGEQREDLVELKFKPNPHFRPPSHEAAVVHAMEGVLWVNGRQKRLVEISGHLIHPVKFGAGLLGHLDAGGHFHVKQEEVQPGYWELAVLDVDMKGKALFFKTIGVQEETKRTMFRRVRDDLTAAQGADLLNQQGRTISGAATPQSILRRCCFRALVPNRAIEVDRIARIRDLGLDLAYCLKCG